MREDFTPTQEEADACAYIESMPITPDADFEALSKLRAFVAAYSRRHGGFPRPTVVVDSGIAQCILERDPSRFKAILQHQWKIVEAMFDRCGFDYAPETTAL